MALPNAIPEREAYILQQVRYGAYEARWAQIESKLDDIYAVFTVMADALKVDGVRVNVSAQLEQQIADSLDCSLLTPKLADLIWLQSSVKVPPYPRQITSSTAATIEHSQKIDRFLASLGDPQGIISTVGKHWVIDRDLEKHPGMAENYGWHFSGPSFQGIQGETTATLMKDPRTKAYYRLIQGRGWAHNIKHVDYSQTCVLVAKQCWIDGVLRNLSDVLTDARLSFLASHNGVTQVLRQPGVVKLPSIMSVS